MTKRPQVGHDGISGHEMAYDKVGQHLLGGQGQVGGPRFGHSDACEPWGYVAAAVVTRAIGVRHIYLIYIRC